MAGSAINLGGMLSQMGNAMGSMGQTVGSGMFDPMKELQEENREQARIDEEKALIKAQAEAKAKAFSAPQKAYTEAENSGDSKGARAAANQMREVAIAEGDMAGVAKADAMLTNIGAIADKGAMKGFRGINEILANDEMTSQMTPEQRKSLEDQKEKMMLNTGVQEYIQNEADKKTQRDMQKATMTNTQMAIEAKKRVVAKEKETVKLLAEEQAAHNQGYAVSPNASEKELTIATANMTEAQKKTFNAARVSRVNFETQKEAIKLNEQMSEEEFAQLGLDMKYSEYAAQGDKVRSYKHLNESVIKAASSKRTKEETNVQAAPRVPKEGQYTMARELLEDSSTDIYWDFRTNAAAQDDVDLMATAYANGLFVGEMEQHINDGKLTPQGKTDLKQALASIGIKYKAPPADPADNAKTWPNAPAVGTVVDGQRYNGDNPGNPSNWSKV